MSQDAMLRVLRAILFAMAGAQGGVALALDGSHCLAFGCVGEALPKLRSAARAEGLLFARSSYPDVLGLLSHVSKAPHGNSAGASGWGELKLELLAGHESLTTPTHFVEAHGTQLNLISLAAFQADDPVVRQWLSLDSKPGFANGVCVWWKDQRAQYVWGVASRPPLLWVARLDLERVRTKLRQRFTKPDAKLLVARYTPCSIMSYLVGAEALEFQDELMRKAEAIEAGARQ